jgi:sarcosine oxidase subunit beta
MEVVVVGGGIVGVSAALTLVERGVDVVVLERGSVAGEASGLNAGVISGGGWGDRPDIEVALKMGSRDRYIDLSQERGHDIGLDLTGTLTLIRTEEEWAWATATVEADRRAGRCLELVRAEELADLEPAVDPGLLGAVLDPLGARAEPVAATEAFAAEAVSAGAVIETGRAVHSLRALAGGGWEVGVDTADTSVVGADAVIIAAGPWCAELGAMVGVEVPIVAVKGQMWASEPQRPVLRHAIAAAESPLAWSTELGRGQHPPELTHRSGRRVTRHLYGRQRPGGEIVFGGDRVLTAERGVDDEGIAVNHRHVGELLPLVRDLHRARRWAGLMPFSLDGRPLLGPISGHEGLFLAGGLASSGFGRGPMAGQVIADLVMGLHPGFDTAAVTPGDRVAPPG